MFVDSVNDRVGIGTTTPTEKLDIGSNGNILLNTSGWSAGAIRFTSNVSGALPVDNFMIQRGGSGTYKDYLLAPVVDLVSFRIVFLSILLTYLFQ